MRGVILWIALLLGVSSSIYAGDLPPAESYYPESSIPGVTKFGERCQGTDLIQDCGCPYSRPVQVRFRQPLQPAKIRTYVSPHTPVSSFFDVEVVVPEETIGNPQSKSLLIPFRYPRLSTKGANFARVPYLEPEHYKIASSVMTMGHLSPSLQLALRSQIARIDLIPEATEQDLAQLTRAIIEPLDSACINFAREDLNGIDSFSGMMMDVIHESTANIPLQLSARTVAPGITAAEAEHPVLFEPNESEAVPVRLKFSTRERTHPGMRISLKLQGSATCGRDFQISNYACPASGQPLAVTVPANEAEFSLFLYALQDKVAEPIEYVDATIDSAVWVDGNPIHLVNRSVSIAVMDPESEKDKVLAPFGLRTSLPAKLSFPPTTESCGVADFCERWFPVGTKLQASVITSAKIENWYKHPDCGTASSCEVEVPASLRGEAYAFLVEGAHVSIQVEGVGRIQTRDREIDCGDGNALCKALFKKGTDVSVGAFGTSDSGEVFLGWQTGPCSTTAEARVNPICDFVVQDTDLSIKAFFGNGVPVSVSRNEFKGAICDSVSGKCALYRNSEEVTGSFSFALGAQAKILASGSPEQPTVFDKWLAGPCVGSTNPLCSFKVVPGLSLRAGFKRDPSKVKVTIKLSEPFLPGDPHTRISLSSNDLNVYMINGPEFPLTVRSHTLALGTQIVLNTENISSLTAPCEMVGSVVKSCTLKLTQDLELTASKKRPAVSMSAVAPTCRDDASGINIQWTAQNADGCRVTPLGGDYEYYSGKGSQYDVTLPASAFMNPADMGYQVTCFQGVGAAQTKVSAAKRSNCSGVWKGKITKFNVTAPSSATAGVTLDFDSNNAERCELTTSRGESRYFESKSFNGVVPSYFGLSENSKELCLQCRPSASYWLAPSDKVCRTVKIQPATASIGFGLDKTATQVLPNGNLRMIGTYTAYLGLHDGSSLSPYDLCRLDVNGSKYPVGNLLSTGEVVGRKVFSMVWNYTIPSNFLGAINPTMVCRQPDAQNSALLTDDIPLVVSKPNMKFTLKKLSDGQFELTATYSGLPANYNPPSFQGTLSFAGGQSQSFYLMPFSQSVHKAVFTTQSRGSVSISYGPYGVSLSLP